jgi:lysophospholipase L1-like esterase
MNNKKSEKNKSMYEEPFKVMVVIGESTVAGRKASEKQFQWPTVVANQISEFQEKDVKLYNKGIGSNVISPNSVGYDDSGKPSAIERVEKDVIQLDPNLVIIAYGLNDMRCNTPIEQFKMDYQKTISKIKKETNALIVLVSVYHMTKYQACGPFWDKGSIEKTKIFNLAIEQLAKKNRCIFTDVYEAEGAADWLIDPDGIHANDLGHRLIGNRVFEAIANHCSCLARKIERITKERKASWDWEQYADWEILKERMKRDTL